MLSLKMNHKDFDSTYPASSYKAVCLSKSQSAYDKKHKWIMEEYALRLHSNSLIMWEMNRTSTFVFTVQASLISDIIIAQGSDH